jgi:hypothetical protein
MRRQVMRRFLILLMAFVPAAASAQTPATADAAIRAGNLPSGFYVPSPCIKPDKKAVGTFPAREPQQWAVYNRKVAKFNQAANAFNACLKTYLDNSQHDIERIVSTVNAEVAEARGTALPPPPAALGNMPADFYPHSWCGKPDQGMIGPQPSTSDHEAMVAYNLRVAAFNAQAVTFSACLKTYQDNAQRDIQAIQIATHAATTDADGP